MVLKNRYRKFMDQIDKSKRMVFIIKTC